MIVTITKVSQEFTKNGDEYRKVTGATSDNKGGTRETTKSIFNQLKDKWGLLVEGKTLEFTMEQKGQFWNVVDIKEPDLPPSKEPEPLLEQHQEVVDKAVGQTPKKEPAPQAVGMITKEIGDMIRAKYLFTLFGEDAQIELIKWYRGQVLGITRVNYDGSKLPDFKKKE